MSKKTVDPALNARFVLRIRPFPAEAAVSTKEASGPRGGKVPEGVDANEDILTPCVRTRQRPTNLLPQQTKETTRLMLSILIMHSYKISRTYRRLITFNYNITYTYILEDD